MMTIYIICKEENFEQCFYSFCICVIFFSNKWVLSQELITEYLLGWSFTKHAVVLGIQFCLTLSLSAVSMTHRGILDTSLDNRIWKKSFEVVHSFFIHNIIAVSLLYIFGCLKCGPVTFGNLSFLYFGITHIL